MRTLEQRRILDAAAAIKLAERKEAKAARPPRVRPEAAGQREPPQKDRGFVAWVHEWSCIACLIEGPAPAILPNGRPNVIEAAHQKHTDLKGPSLGNRSSDWTCVPLCSWHHRYAPVCCDPAQRKFWDRLRVDIGAFCRALYAAFRAGELGEPVIRKFAADRGVDGQVRSRER